MFAGANPGFFLKVTPTIWNGTFFWKGHLHECYKRPKKAPKSFPNRAPCRGHGSTRPQDPPLIWDQRTKLLYCSNMDHQRYWTTAFLIEACTLSLLLVYVFLEYRNRNHCPCTALTRNTTNVHNRNSVSSWIQNWLPKSVCRVWNGFWSWSVCSGADLACGSMVPPYPINSPATMTKSFMLDQLRGSAPTNAAKVARCLEAVQSAWEPCLPITEKPQSNPVQGGGTRWWQ